MNFSMKDFLLPSIDMTTVFNLNKAIYDHATPFVALIFMCAVLWEHLSGSQKSYQDLLLRTIYLLFFSLLGHKILEGGVEKSLFISDALVYKFSPKSEFLTNFTTNKEGFWNSVTEAWEMATTSPIISVIWILCWIAIFTVGHIFTLVYKLTYIAIPLSCVISIFPFTKDAATGVLKSIFWCIITPIVSALVLIIIGAENFSPENWSAKWNTIIQVLLYSITIFYIPGLTTMFLTNQGFQSAGEKLSGMAASSALTLGKYYIIKGALGALSRGSSFVYNPIANTVGEKLYSLKNNISGKSNHLDGGRKLSAFDKPSRERWRAGSKASELKKLAKLSAIEMGSRNSREKRSIPASSPLTIHGNAERIQSRSKDFNPSQAKFTAPNSKIDPHYGILKLPKNHQNFNETNKNRIATQWGDGSPKIATQIPTANTGSQNKTQFSPADSQPKGRFCYEQRYLNRISELQRKPVSNNSIHPSLSPKLTAPPPPVAEENFTKG